MAHVADPFGHKWAIATHTEDVSPEEMEKRMAAMGSKSRAGHEDAGVPVARTA